MLKEEWLSQFLNSELLTLFSDPSVELSEEQKQLILKYCNPYTTLTTQVDENDKMKLMAFIDKSIQNKYIKVIHLVSHYQPQLQGKKIKQQEADLLVDSVKQLCDKVQQTSINLIHRKLALSKQITDLVKVNIKIQT
ncbi:unnamed protein product [Cunninghamella blakesleeana]